MRWFQAGNPTG